MQHEDSSTPSPSLRRRQNPLSDAPPQAGERAHTQVSPSLAGERFREGVLRLYVIGIKWPAETFLMRKLHGLAASGMEITVCSASVKAPGRDAETGIHLLPLIGFRQEPAALLNLMKWIGKNLIQNPYRTRKAFHIACRGRSYREAVHVFARLQPFIIQQPDIIHFEWNTDAILYESLFDLIGCPVVISCRGSQITVAPHNPERAWIRDGLPRTFERAAAVHCVSDAIKAEAVHLGLNPEKARIIRPAVDPNVFKPSEHRSREHQPFKIVTTGALIWRKGFEHALVALRKLLDKGIDAQLTIIGDGEEKQRLLFTIDDLGLATHVTLAGRLRPEQVVAHLQQADAFLLSSLTEGISNAVLEAMACGLPVVTTECGGMREAITNGIEGFIVPVFDAEAMANALAELARHPDLRLRMSRAGRERILRDFTLDQQIAKWLEVYRHVAA